MSRPPRLRRFSRTERAAHWLLAVSFFVLLATGLALYLPSLADVVTRPRAKAWHLDAAIALGVGLVALPFVGDHGALRRTLRDIDRFDRDDLRWLLGGPGRLLTRREAPPQGRLNAGQKVNAVLVGAGMTIMYVTGFLLWQGERDTTYHFAGTVLVHDWVTWILLLLVAGHVYLAVLHPATRHALRGMTLGDVDGEWARRHHPKWVAEEEERTRRAAPAAHGDGPPETSAAARR